MYLLSKLIPVRMTSNYRVNSTPGARHRSVWWQWRGHVFRHRMTVQ